MTLLRTLFLVLVLAGCSESPQQRAERIVQECRAVMAKLMEEVRRADPRSTMGISDEQNLVIKCILEHGKGDSR